MILLLKFCYVYDCFPAKETMLRLLKRALVNCKMTSTPPAGKPGDQVYLNFFNDVTINSLLRQLDCNFYMFNFENYRI